MKKASLITIGFLLLVSPVASAYELATHGRITKQAYFRSSIYLDANLLFSLGIDGSELLSNPYYYDLYGSKINSRTANKFSVEDERMPEFDEEGPIIAPENDYPFTAIGWLLRGAIREDDVPWPAGNRFPWQDPDPTPGLPIFRVVNHFYDPVYSRPLQIPLISDGEKAPNWALGVNDFLGAPDTPNTTRRNHFTLFDARETMYRALTGQDAAGSTAIVPDGGGGARTPNDTIEAEQVRKAYWATTFRALGDVLHLVEDMAQPQHTRNDPHLFNGSLDKQAFEHYTDARAKGTDFKCANGNKIDLPALVYGTYPKPSFNRYSDYFSTVPDGNVVPGKGMADYSNRGFFSAGTNIRDNQTPDLSRP